jgi:hypothetical protein
MRSDFNHYSMWVLATIALAGLPGCATLAVFDKQAVPAKPESPSAASYFVEMHSQFGKPTVYQGEITKPTTVQEALDASGASDKYASMTIDLYRLLPDGNHIILPVEFQQKKKQVKYEQDYALHPNDRIIVLPKSSSVMDKFVDQVFGKL